MPIEPLDEVPRCCPRSSRTRGVRAAVDALDAEAGASELASPLDRCADSAAVAAPEDDVAASVPSVTRLRFSSQCGRRQRRLQEGPGREHQARLATLLM